MNHLEIKSGPDGALIYARHFDPVMVPIWVILLEKSPMMEHSAVVVTSGSDSHDLGLHPHCRALDVRTSDVLVASAVNRGGKVEKWAADIRLRLGTDYDVVVEEDHIHIEYDPKG